MESIALIADYARSRKNTSRTLLNALYGIEAQAYLWNPKNRQRVRQKILRIVEAHQGSLPLLMTNIDGVESWDDSPPLQQQAIALTRGKIFSVVVSCSSDVWRSVEELQRCSPAVCTPLAIHLPYVLDETVQHYAQRIRQGFLSLPPEHPFYCVALHNDNDAKRPAGEQDAPHR